MPTTSKRQKRQATGEADCPGRSLNPFPLQADGDRRAMVEWTINGPTRNQIPIVWWLMIFCLNVSFASPELCLTGKFGRTWVGILRGVSVFVCWHDITFLNLTQGFVYILKEQNFSSETLYFIF